MTLSTNYNHALTAYRVYAVMLEKNTKIPFSQIRNTNRAFLELRKQIIDEIDTLAQTLSVTYKDDRQKLVEEMTNETKKMQGVELTKEQLESLQSFFEQADTESVMKIAKGDDPTTTSNTVLAFEGFLTDLNSALTK